MKERKNLHDISIVLILLTGLYLYSFINTMVVGWFDGSIAKTLSQVSAESANGVKIAFIAVTALCALSVLAQLAIGSKGLKISAQPKNKKGYIRAAKLFFVLHVIAAISQGLELADPKVGTTVSNILALCSTLCNVAAYGLFVHYAKAVCRSVSKKS